MSHTSMPTADKNKTLDRGQLRSSTLCSNMSVYLTPHLLELTKVDSTDGLGQVLYLRSVADTSRISNVLKRLCHL